MSKNDTPTRREAFKAANDSARNEDGLTMMRWKIQSEMERAGFVYDPAKGEPDVEAAYSCK